MNHLKNSKNIFRTFSGVVGSVGSVHRQIVPWSSLYFPTSIGPFLCSQYQLQGFNLLHLSLPRRFPLFQLLLFLVSSVSNFYPDTGGQWWSLFQAHLFSHAVGREGHCKQITLACAHSVSATLGFPPLTAYVLSCLHC